MAFSISIGKDSSNVWIESVSPLSINKYFNLSIFAFDSLLLSTSVSLLVIASNNVYILYKQ